MSDNGRWVPLRRKLIWQMKSMARISEVVRLHLQILTTPRGQFRTLLKMRRMALLYGARMPLLLKGPDQ